LFHGVNRDGEENLCYTEIDEKFEQEEFLMTLDADKQITLLAREIIKEAGKPYTPEQLAEIPAILAAKSRYFWCIDNQEFELMPDVFTAEGFRTFWSGRPGNNDRYKQVEQNKRTCGPDMVPLHFGYNQIVHFTGPRSCQLLTRMHDYHTYKDNGDTVSIYVYDSNATAETLVIPDTIDFKPVTAITVIAAVYLGRESGFLVGAMAALLSNFYFGQGPWTAFQMLSWGLIGWFAGLFADPLKRHRALLLLYGVLSGIAYSLLMDVWTVMSFHGQFTLPLYLAAAATSMPHMLLYAVSNFLFLWWMAKPFGDKLERIRIKYGI